MKAITRIVIVFALTFSKCLTTVAQRLVISKNEIGFGAGVMVYQGDLTPSRLGSYRTLRPVAAIFVNHVVNPMFSLRANLALGGLKGDDSKYPSPAYRQQRNFEFKSPVFEISGLVVADLRKNNLSLHPGLSPYLFAGLGLSVLRIRRDDSRFNSEYFSSERTTIEGLSADRQHSLPRAIPVIPLGAGIKYAITPRMSVSLETSYRASFTDYLDGFSKAANDKRKDSYQTHTLGLVYRFVSNNSMKCPVF